MSTNSQAEYERWIGQQVLRQQLEQQEAQEQLSRAARQDVRNQAIMADRNRAQLQREIDEAQARERQSQAQRAKEQAQAQAEWATQLEASRRQQLLAEWVQSGNIKEDFDKWYKAHEIELQAEHTRAYQERLMRRSRAYGAF